MLVLTSTPLGFPGSSGTPGEDSGTPLRRELLLTLSVLFAGGLVLACVALLLVLPVLETPLQTALFLGLLVVGDLAVLFFFGRALLDRTILVPLDGLVRDTGKIAEGDFRHRVETTEVREFRKLARGINRMADRLIEDQERLAENVASLEETNRSLVRARDQMVQAARLASVGSLAAGVAHEVGNPLSAIVGYVDVARKRAREGGDGVGELLDAIREEADRIDRIVRGILDFARPPRGDRKLTPPEDVLKEVRDLMDSQGKLDGVEHRWDLQPDPDAAIDAHRTEHVLVNLMLNALDALEEGGGRWLRVTLRVEPGEAYRLPRRREEDPPGVDYVHRRRVFPREDEVRFDSLRVAERVVVITVEDDGPGLPEGVEDRIFDPFFTTKDPGKGTGLGLAICAQLVEGMGGRIQASNRPEGGARFTVRLPSRAPGEEEEESGMRSDFRGEEDVPERGHPGGRGGIGGAGDSGGGEP